MEGRTVSARTLAALVAVWLACPVALVVLVVGDSQPSDQAKRWDNAVPKKPRCPECGFLLSERRECVMGCGEPNVDRGEN